MSTIKEIRETSGLSRAEFSRTYNIPVRTLEDWETEKRTCPQYVESLLERAVKEDQTEFPLYKNKELMQELGTCYAALLRVIKGNRYSTSVDNPYPNADIFPVKYFTIVHLNAMKVGITRKLNERIANFMNFIDLEDWTNCMNKPSPWETRVWFDTGMMMPIPRNEKNRE